ncbi:hypothetical protein LLE67_04115 [Xanthomonas campestris]|uniref:hypothetical protein n=1 Tax=Xanthomonas campestris TaxID=339 RepID=UPI001E3D9A55|nr:hypothetical protein [Xanthomonas campestris]MCC5067032.1 hypothetical protein [Xanthomonas campestris]
MVPNNAVVNRLAGRGAGILAVIARKNAAHCHRWSALARDVDFPVTPHRAQARSYKIGAITVPAYCARRLRFALSSKLSASNDAPALLDYSPDNAIEVDIIAARMGMGCAVGDVCCAAS